MPTLRLSDDDRATIRRLAGAAAAPRAPAMPAPEAAPATPSEPSNAGEAPQGAEALMGEHFDLMRRFLAQQHDVLAGWQAASAAPSDEVPAADDAPASPAAPFLDQIVEHDTDHLLARCHLALHRDAFLRDHVLSGPGSATDPALLGLACVPLMVSLEIMAQACAVLAGHAGLCTITDVRASDWIALDDEELVLDVAAQVDDGAAGRYRATLRQSGELAVSAVYCFAPEPWQVSPLDDLGAAKPARWDGAEIYDVGMFHGPIFQTLRHIAGWNERGIDAELTPCSTLGFFEPGAPAALVMNPVLLDAMGQLAACWVAEHVGTDFNCFPSSIERIELYQPDPGQRDGIRLRGRQRALDAAAAASDMTAARSWDFEALDAAGAPLVRVRGLVNVFFHVPHRFYQLRRDPLAGWLGAPLAGPQGTLLWKLDQLDEEFCAQSNAIFLRILAHAVLSFEEREAWRTLGHGVRRRREWLLGRLALKEAVRYALHLRRGDLLYPSDIVVRHDAQGAPFVDGWWAGHEYPAPNVSLSHNSRYCLAALADEAKLVGVDAEVVGRVQRPEWLASAFTSAESAWLAGRATAGRDVDLLRVWCAKEAASKWLGSGLQGRPEAFEVSFVDDDAGHALVQCGELAVPVRVLRLEGSVVAVAEADSRVNRVAG